MSRWLFLQRPYESEKLRGSYDLSSDDFDGD